MIEGEHNIYRLEEYKSPEGKFVVRASFCTNNDNFFKDQVNHLRNIGIEFKITTEGKLACVKWEAIRVWRFDIDNMVS